MVFASLNNSVALNRIHESENHIEKLHTKCYKLAYEDEELAKTLKQHVENINKQFDEVWKDSKQNKVDHERKFGDFYHRISTNFESIKKLK